MLPSSPSSDPPAITSLLDQKLRAPLAPGSRAHQHSAFRASLQLQFDPTLGNRPQYHDKNLESATVYRLLRETALELPASDAATIISSEIGPVRGKTPAFSTSFEAENITRSCPRCNSNPWGPIPVCPQPALNNVPLPTSVHIEFRNLADDHLRHLCRT